MHGFFRQICCGIALALSATTVAAQSANPPGSGDWPYYRGQLSGSGYSSLAQIDDANVSRLVQAWRYDLRSDASPEAAARNPNSQVTPIMVDDTLYLTAADRVVALDPVSGLERWRHEVSDGGPSRRGVSYWPGMEGVPPRIYLTVGNRLLALDAATGVAVAEFGQGGEVDLGIPYISVPLVHDDVIVVGANTPSGAAGGIGNARAFDARSGAKLWEFDSVPWPGAIGHDTWAGDSWRGRLGANAWPFYFTVDGERDLLYLPLASPLPFAYGGDRAGDNLFANSIVAVNLHSGEYVWHFQTIHHDLWDHDPPAPPTLFDMQRDGVEVPALAVTTKSGYLFILNRVTGEPLVEVLERPVARSQVPGEQSSPTQPFPRTPPLARVSYEPADQVSAADTSAAHAQACAELLSSVGALRNEGPYTPWNYRSGASDTGGTIENVTTLLFPGLGGGPNWGGAPYDPASGYVFVFTGDTGTLGWVQDADAGAAVPYVLSGPRPAGFEVRLDGVSLPCQKPPWGRLTAVDTRSGEIAWQQTLGVTESLPEATRNTGRPGRAGALVTGSGLVFIAATDDNRLRALQAGSGRLLWETELDDRGNANPMTYLGSDDRQYVVISATDTLVGFRLP
ncbi:MAG: hypothetical protein RLZZ385_96 [Pseudomonadota bacterium]|jgi:quinoprotein glucose dehydrogenase